MITDDGILFCVEAKTGEVVWRQRIAGNISASPLHAAGRTYLFDQNAKNAVLQPARHFQPRTATHLTAPHLYRLKSK